MSKTTMLRIAALPLLWVATVCFMVRDWLQDPYDPGLEGTRRYGHNHEDALASVLVLSFFELVALAAILRPWSYDRSWGRSLTALALLVPWTGISMIATMHAGGIAVLHFMWLAVLMLGLLIAFTWSAIARYGGLTS